MYNGGGGHVLIQVIAYVIIYTGIANCEEAPE